MSRRWWLLFRSLAVPTILFLAPALTVQELHPLSYLLSMRGAPAELALQISVVLLIEILCATFLCLILWVVARLGCGLIGPTLAVPDFLHWQASCPGTALMQLRNGMLFNAANGLAVNALLRDFGWFFGRFNNAAWVEPRAVFASAEAFVRGTPAPYFLWVHLYPPHGPYLTYQRFLGRFLPGSDFTTQAQYFWQTPGADYPPAMQHEVDLLRLRYDESIANCDNALGEFLDWMTRDGRDANTILIGTSDHGENFSGGRWTHESPNLIMRKPTSHC